MNRRHFISSLAVATAATSVLAVSKPEDNLRPIYRVTEPGGSWGPRVRMSDLRPGDCFVLGDTPDKPAKVWRVETPPNLVDGVCTVVALDVDPASLEPWKLENYRVNY